MSAAAPLHHSEPGASMRSVARRLYRLGYVPIPLGQDKVPLVKWGSYHVTPPTPEELREWPWERAVGVGVVTGRPHGLVVVDADDAPSWRWARTNLPTTRGTLSRRGGHLHFRHPARGIIGNRSGLRAVVIDEDVSLDVKGLGGMATAPDSRHPSGVIYRPYGDWGRPVSELPILPSIIVAQAEDRPRPPVPPPPRHRFRGDPVRGIERYLAKVGGLPEEGSGSDVAVFRAAAWAKHNAPDLREDEFIAAVLRERPEFHERWIATKWRSAGRR